MLVTGFPYDVHQRVQEIVGLFAEFVGRARAVRRLGSAAIDLCYVAAGRMDGFWERDLKPWDIAGGALMVSEAGGTITNFRGEPFTSRGADVRGQQRPDSPRDARRHRRVTPPRSLADADCRRKPDALISAARQFASASSVLPRNSRSSCGIAPASEHGDQGRRATVSRMTPAGVAALRGVPCVVYSLRPRC